MADLQVQAKALGDPTRHGIFQYLLDAGGPVDVAELTDHFGLNHNAIRQHLAKLVDAGLVTEATASARGRGRPRLTYAPHPSADSRWGATGPYERLAVLLTEIVRTGESPEEIGRRAGRRLSRGVRSDDPTAALAELMAQQGFEPVVQERGESAELTLLTCPFTSAVLADPDTVCELHLGMARGAAEGIGGGLVVEELIPKDPRRARCRLLCRSEAASEH
jgi:predicted ArsR family transcriptional regulator